MKKFVFVLFGLMATQLVFSASTEIKRVEPLFWWAGMKNPNLQLMVYGQDISETDVTLNYPGVCLVSVSKVENPNYLFIDLHLSPEAKPGNFDILFQEDGQTVAVFPYELKERHEGSSQRNGFNSSDVIYLITPDRFVNGDPSNDAVAGMKEQPNRADRDGRHGGDLRGIINNLDYLKTMGFTAVWLNPVLENNMSRTSYHGYATTNFYKVDPRYGSNEEYLELSVELKKRGMKLIMDMIFNHCGSEHWWMDDVPMPGWINHYPDYRITNHRRTVNQDPYAAEADIRGMVDGWFDTSMPDLNQQNPFLANYLIQNSIWWIEYAGLEGIRQDTWPYPDKKMMAEWTRKVLEEYPNFTIVGEEWSLNPAIVAYWQRGKNNSDGYECSLPSLMDFPLQHAVSRALRNQESWDSGLIELYEALSNDFQYAHPENLVVFPDNHDMARFYVQVGNDADLLKMGLAYFLTTRGIPQIYYGTEILMSHPGDAHGDIRADYPGGWQNDKVNAFTGNGLTEKQTEVQHFVTHLLNWRKKEAVIHNGHVMHFVPENGIYVFFRYNNDKTIMIILNKNRSDTVLPTRRFSERMHGFSAGREIITSRSLEDLSQITVPARSAMIIELMK
jgi:neopullulanase